MAEAFLGMEVLKLDPDPRAPWRMTCDVWEDGEIVRYQLTGMSYERRVRSLDELAAVQLGTPIKREETARRLDELDRQAAEKIAPIVRDLKREQIRVLHGDEGVALFDRDGDG